MAHRSKTSSRRTAESASDPFEAVKPLVVLVLLGMIGYGAYSVIQRGPSSHGSPSGPPPASVAAPPAIDVPPIAAVPPAPVPAPSTFGTPPAPRDVEVSAAPAAAPSAEPPVAVAPPAPPSQVLPSQVLKAETAPPPVAEASAVPSPAIEAVPPPAPPRQSAAFAAAWADAHDKLANARYAEALAVLSGWYDDATLAPEESQRLEELLGQLAGTVIYSQQDHLLPPHIVAQGETLRDIAGPLSVPWQLLAKINGVDAPARLVNGELLKVVQGPFDASVSLARGRLSLQLNGSYAGSFPVAVGREVHKRVGSQLVVERVRRGNPRANPPRVTGPVQQAANEEEVAEKRVLLDGGFSIESADDPVASADAASGMSLVVSARDLDEIVDILGGGSRIFVKP